MTFTRDRLRSVGWAALLLVCAALLLAMTFKVNAVKSELRQTELRIVALKHDKLLLETEFETRANQQQLRALNDVEFGYHAPTSGQYLEGERQLAALGKARGPGAPSPIRVASVASIEEGQSFAAMVSPLTGKAMAAEAPRDGEQRKPATTANLGERLSHLDSAGPQVE
jgi:hypothetical protein